MAQQQVASDWHPTQPTFPALAADRSRAGYIGCLGGDNNLTRQTDLLNFTFELAIAAAVQGQLKPPCSSAIASHKRRQSRSVVPQHLTAERHILRPYLAPPKARLEARTFPPRSVSIQAGREKARRRA